MLFHLGLAVEQTNSNAAQGASVFQQATSVMGNVTVWTVLMNLAAVRTNNEYAMLASSSLIQKCLDVT